MRTFRVRKGTSREENLRGHDAAGDERVSGTGSSYLASIITDAASTYHVDLAQLLQRFNGDIDLTLAAYNAGPELVAKVGPLPNAEAIDYVAKIKSYYENALAAL